MQLDNNLTYNELLDLSADDCVFVNRVYFFFLFAKAQKLDKQNYIFDIFKKYLEIEDLEDKLNPNRKISGYYIMLVDDIKILIDTIKQNLWNNSLFKCNITKLELEQIHNSLKQQYVEKNKLEPQTKIRKLVN